MLTLASGISKYSMAIVSSVDGLKSKASLTISLSLIWDGNYKRREDVIKITRINPFVDTNKMSH